MTSFNGPGMVLSVLLFSTSSLAQGQNWGTGMYPANPACGFQNSIGSEATSIRDELNQRTRELAQAKSDLRKFKGRQSSLRASANSQRDLFKLSGFDGSTFNAIETHVNSGSSCGSYRGACEFRSSGGYSNLESEAPSRRPAADLYTPPPEDVADQPIEQEPAVNPPVNPGRGRPRPEYRPAACQDGPLEWSGGMRAGVFLSHCGPGPGEVRGSICNVQPDASSAPRARNPNSCQKYLQAWQDKNREMRALENEIAELDARILELEALTKSSKIELAEAMKEREQNMRAGITEANCVNCGLQGGGAFQQPRSSLWDLAGGVVAAGFNAYSSYKLGQYVSNNNAKLGFQTQQIPLSGHLLSAGWPLISGGLYGVLGGGGGQGSFGCGGGPYGGGQFGQNGFAGVGGFQGPYGVNGVQGSAMFGFPQQMYGTPAGGGMFNVGMGAGFSPGYGLQAYCPVQPCPVNGQLGLGGQFGGGPGGFPGGAPYNPYQPGMGTNLGFSAGFNGGIPGVPGYGQAGGQFGYGGFPGGVGGQYGFGGLPGYAGMPGYSGIPGYGASGGVWAGTPGFNPGASGQFQIGGGAGAGGSQFMNYQYQQQMAQAQAQHYAMLAQQQQQQYQAQVAQQQTLNNLYGELSSLQGRIQSAQFQTQTGGYLGFQGNFGVGAGIQPGLPYYGPPGNTAITPQPYPYQQGAPGAVPAGVPTFSR